MNKLFNKILLITLLIFAVIALTNVASAAQNISQCTNISTAGEYIVNQTINSSGTCLTIRASNVDVNCNGNIIAFAGGGTNGVAGINASNASNSYSNLTVRNCIIVKSSIAGTTGYGIQLNRFSNSTIYNNTILTNGTNDNYGIYLLNNAQRNNITQNIIQSKGSTTNNYGIYISQGISSTVVIGNNITTLGTATNYGIYLLGNTSNSNTNNTITNNLISTSGTAGAGGANNFGIYLNNNVSYNNVSQNNISTNGTTTNYGIYLNGAALASPVNYNEISNNIVQTAGSIPATTNYGIYLQNSANNNSIMNNNVSTKGSANNYGIHLLGTLALAVNNNTIYDNTIQTNGNATNNYGIYLLTNANNNNITGNTISTNGTTGNAGVVISGTTANSTLNIIYANTIQTAGTTTNYGIYINTNASQNLVYRNNINASGTTTSYGIYLLGSANNPVNNNTITENNILTNCTAASSSCYGIYLNNNVNNNTVVSNTINTTGTSTNAGIYLFGTTTLSVNSNIIIGNTIKTAGTVGAGGANNFGIYLNNNVSYNNVSQNNISTNGTTTNYGIYLNGAALASPVNYNEISNNIVQTAGFASANTNYGIYVQSSSNNNTLVNNNITTRGTTANYGIHLLGTLALAVNNNTIYDNTIQTNGNATNNYGIYLLTNANNNNITGNTISTNGTTGNAGVVISGTTANSTLNIIYANTIQTGGNTTNYGIYINTNASQNIILQNLISTSGVTTSYGIYLLGSANNPVNNNTISTNTITTSCIFVASSCHGIYLQNNVNNNTLLNNNLSLQGTGSNYGIYLFGTTALPVNTNIVNNNTVQTRGNSTNNYGIYLLTNANNNNITNNTISTNGTNGNAGVVISGVTSTSVSNEISYNIISTQGNNTNYGIQLDNSSNNNIAFNSITTNGSDVSNDALYIYRLSRNNTFVKNIVILAEGNAINLVNTTGVNYPNNNTFSNNTFQIVDGRDLIIGQAIDSVILLDQKIRGYNFTRNITSLVVSNSLFGEIRFISNVSGNGTNLDSEIYIDNNTAFINSSKATLNVSANITLRGIGNRGFVIPSILRNGQICNGLTNPSCYNYTSLTDENVSFNITKGGIYVIGEGGDVVAPNINFTYPTQYNATIRTNNILVNVSATDTNISNITIRLYESNILLNQTSSSSSSLFVNFAGLNEGNYSINATSCDTSNNCNTTQTLQIKVDLAPKIVLISPLNNAGLTSNQIILVYNVSDAFNVANCSLIVDNATIEVNTSIIKGENIFEDILSYGKHTWQIRCVDESGNQNISSIRTFNLIDLGQFSAHTTNLTLVDIENVSGFTVESQGIGSINFTQNVNLSGVYDLASHITITNNLISVDSNALPSLNVSARLQMSNITLQKPVILRNGFVCNECSISNYNGSDIIFTVEHFTNYSTAENSRLVIFDDSDNIPFYGGALGFYANYTNRTDNSPIISADCRIVNNGTENIMTYNALTKLYTYTENIFVQGQSNYSISCTESNFASINLTDFYFVQNSSRVPSGARITPISTSSGQSQIGETDSAFAYNVSELSLFGWSNTQGWQGYYGNVSGTIVLEESQGQVMYNWSETLVLGEVYASRANNINFQTVTCADNSDISAEEAFAGQNINDSDSISNTFATSVHPQFTVGNININQNSCRATNINSPNISTFYEVILSDISSNIIYTSILENDKPAFNNKTSDFEMIVPENGHNGDTSSTPYYFYIELG